MEAYGYSGRTLNNAMVQGGEVSSAAETNGTSSSHLDDGEAADSHPVAERDPSERYSRVQQRSPVRNLCYSLECQV